MKCRCGGEYKVTEEKSGGGYVWFNLICDQCGGRAGLGVPDDSYFVYQMRDYLRAEGCYEV